TIPVTVVRPSVSRSSNAFRNYRRNLGNRNLRRWFKHSRNCPAAQGLWPGTLAQRKGITAVRLADGSLHHPEVHWYEAAGIGRKEFKIKHRLRGPSHGENST